jgi:hypothetical protein
MSTNSDGEVVKAVGLFETWWAQRGIITGPPGVLCPFRAAAEAAWFAALACAAENCGEIALAHAQIEGTYAAGKKAGAFDCRDRLVSLSAGREAIASPSVPGAVSH